MLYLWIKFRRTNKTNKKDTPHRRTALHSQWSVKRRYRLKEH